MVMPDAEANATEEALARVESRLRLSRSTRALARRYSGAAVAQVERGPFHWEVNLPIKNSTIAALGRRLGEGKNLDTKNASSTSKPLVDGEPFGDMKILLAEDHPINQKLALSLLGKMGLEADVANNGLEALEALERQNYDVILMDCQMPGMDGFEATRRIRARESEEAATGARRRYIIAVTANAMAGDREICLETGMDDYLSKPISKEGLRAALSRAPRREVAESLDSTSESEDHARPEYEAKVAAIRAHLNQLVEDLGGESVSELVDSFVDEAPEKMDELESTIGSGDSNQIREVAHAFKSVCGIYGFEEMRLMLQAIENAAKAGETVDGVVEMARLRQTYRECSPVLDEFRALSD